MPQNEEKTFQNATQGDQTKLTNGITQRIRKTTFEDLSAEFFVEKMLFNIKKGEWLRGGLFNPTATLMAFIQRPDDHGYRVQVSSKGT